MKKILTLLWALIIVGAGFLAYDHFFATKSPVETPSPVPRTTALQDEAKEEVEENKTYSGYINDGDHYYKQGYYEEALKEYQKALKSNPTSIEALHKIGITHLTNNHPTEAQRYFEQSKEFNSNTQIDVLIGRTYINQRKIEEAVVHFDNLDPENNEVKYYKSILKILYKKYDEAFSGLEPLTIPPATPDTDAPDPDALLRAKAMIFVDAFNEFSLYNEGKETHKELILAKAFIDTGEFEASIPLLYDVINNQNNYRDAWILLGYSYLQTGKIEDAMDAFSQAETFDPQKPQTLFFVGLTYAIQEKFDDAIQYFEKAVEAGFEPISLIEQKLADIYLIQEKYDNALQAYMNIIDLNIADINIFTKAVWICIEKIDKPQRAIGIAGNAIKMMTEGTPEEAVAYNLKGWAYTAYGDYEQAKENLVKALELNPDLDSAYLNIGWMYEKTDLPHIAKEYYKKAYTLGNGNSIANLAAIRFNNILKADITSPTSP